MPAHLHTFLGTLSFAFGACIGSFLNVCVYRIPRDMSVVAPRSHCPHCGRTIPWHCNIPILSFVILRARCRYCRGSISPRYVVIELITAILFLLAYLKFSMLTAMSVPPFGLVESRAPELLPVYWLVISGLIIGTFVDFEHMIIPDRITLGGIVAGIAISAAAPALHNAGTVLESLFRSAVGAATGWMLLWGVAAGGKLIFRKEAMGFGDVKLLGAIGAFFGWKAVLFTVMLSSLAGSAVGITLVLSRLRKMQSRIPYGPYLALAALVWMFWGPKLWHAWLNLLSGMSV